MMLILTGIGLSGVGIKAIKAADIFTHCSNPK